MRKRIGLLCASLALAMAISVGSTFAWLSVYDARLNSLSAPQLDFSTILAEEFVPPGSGPEPGATVPKHVGARNNGDLRAVVRVLLMPVVIAADGETVLPARTGREVLMDIDLAHWADGRDGYYYYLGVLAPGESAPELITKVTLASDLPEAYDGASFRVEVKSEASYARRSDYRRGWWGSSAPPGGDALARIDAVLAPLTPP